MADTETPDLLMSAWAILAERGWSGYSPIVLAERTGVALADIRRDLPDRTALFTQVTDRADAAMLSFPPNEFVGLPARDRVFELIMRRLDALLPFKPGMARLWRDREAEPRPLFEAICRLDRGLMWLQDAGGLPSTGIRAQLTRRAIALVYLRALEVWIKDEGADMAKTMASLDKDLRRVDSVVGFRDAGSDHETAASQPA